MADPAPLLGTQPAMHHEDRLVDQRAEWDLREGRREELEKLLGGPSVQLRFGFWVYKILTVAIN